MQDAHHAFNAVPVLAALSTVLVSVTLVTHMSKGLLRDVGDTGGCHPPHKTLRSNIHNPKPVTMGLLEIVAQTVSGNCPPRHFQSHSICPSMQSSSVMSDSGEPI